MTTTHSTTNIVTLLDSFEMAAYHSMTRGHPPFADIMTQTEKLDEKGRWDVLITLARVWQDAGQHNAVAAKQFCTVLEQKWLTSSNALFLINIGARLARNNRAIGNTDAADAIQTSAKTFPALAAGIERQLKLQPVPFEARLRRA